MDGRISMIDNWSEKQYVEQGAEIMAILPEGSQDSMFIQLMIPIKGSGKVTEGQRVLLKFDNYPHKEYGKVDGVVIDKADLPRNGAYKVEINLPNKLTTRMGKELAFEQEMQGDGEIITENRTVFERIFENIVEPFRQ